MEQKEFWSLYDAGRLQCLTRWEHEIKVEDASFTEEMVCFKYDGKFYIRFTKLGRWEMNYRTNKRTGRALSYGFIKEFDNKDRANNYFKKCKEGFALVKEA